MDNKKFEKGSEKFCCENCDFFTSRKSQYNRHISTLKHKRIIMDNEKVPHVYSCENCEKKYNYLSGLCKHKKKCSKELIQTIIENDLTDKEIILKLLKQNSEFKDMLFEQNKVLLEMSTKNNPVISNSMINSHNKTFNMQVFLNETCKDAMNLMEFVDSLQLQFSDLENVGKNGFVKGISNIIVQNLKALDVTKRPVHCSDYKREIMYVKEDNQWFNDTKETEENQKLKKAINQIAHKNICMIPEWKAKYPDCVFSDSKKSDQYNYIIYESMDQNDVNTEKIIKNIAKEVVINKK